MSDRPLNLWLLHFNTACCTYDYVMTMRYGSLYNLKLHECLLRERQQDRNIYQVEELCIGDVRVAVPVRLLQQQVEAVLWYDVDDTRLVQLVLQL